MRGIVGMPSFPKGSPMVGQPGRVTMCNGKMEKTLGSRSTRGEAARLWCTDMRSSPRDSGRWLKRPWRTGSLVLLFGTTAIGCTGEGPSPEVGRAGGDASRVVAVAAASDLKFAL